MFNFKSQMFDGDLSFLFFFSLNTPYKLYKCWTYHVLLEDMGHSTSQCLRRAETTDFGYSLTYSILKCFYRISIKLQHKGRIS